MLLVGACRPSFRSKHTPRQALQPGNWGWRIRMLRRNQSWSQLARAPMPSGRRHLLCLDWNVTSRNTICEAKYWRKAAEKTQLALPQRWLGQSKLRSARDGCSEDVVSCQGGGGSTAVGGGGEKWYSAPGGPPIVFLSVPHVRGTVINPTPSCTLDVELALCCCVGSGTPPV